MAGDGAASELERLSARIGVLDALVFRRVNATRWAHLGGLGRGRGWAGIVDVCADETMLAGAPGEVRLTGSDLPEHVIGPYYARAAAVVRLTNDVIVVLGHPTDPLRAPHDHDAIRELAVLVDETIEDIAPSKRLGDELEVLHAVRAVVTSPTTSVSETLAHVVAVAAEALSCERTVVRDGLGRIAVSAGWDVPSAGLTGVLDDLTTRADGRIYCVQDTSTEAVSAPFGALDGVHAVLAVAVPEPLGGILVAAHTSAGPRGFTNLCCQVGAQIADTASVIAHTVAIREDLRDLADEQFRRARTDTLTGLGNRTRWEEAEAEAQRRVDDEACPIAVITIDVDGLKEINDTYGHEVGDSLLRRCADILRAHARDHDVLCRVGGDEFAMLLPIGPALAAARAKVLSERFALRSGHTDVAASVGLGTATPGHRVADARRDADAAMYAHKKARRTGRLSAESRMPRSLTVHEPRPRPVPSVLAPGGLPTNAARRRRPYLRTTD